MSLKAKLQKKLCPAPPYSVADAAAAIAKVVKPEEYFRVLDSVERSGGSIGSRLFLVYISRLDGLAISANESTLQRSVEAALNAYRQ